MNEDDEVEVIVHSLKNHECKPCEHTIDAVRELQKTHSNIKLSIMKDSTNVAPVIEVISPCACKKLTGGQDENDIMDAIDSVVCSLVRDGYDDARRRNDEEGDE